MQAAELRALKEPDPGSCEDSSSRRESTKNWRPQGQQEPFPTPTLWCCSSALPLPCSRGAARRMLEKNHSPPAHTCGIVNFGLNFDQKLHSNSVYRYESTEGDRGHGRSCGLTAHPVFP